ncbi:hypothetical protein EMIT0180MI3_360002 [Priestia megaterium]
MARGPGRGCPFRDHARYGVVALPGIPPAARDRRRGDSGRLLPERHLVERDDLAGSRRPGVVGGHRRRHHPPRAIADTGADLAAGLGLVAGVVHGAVLVDPASRAVADRTWRGCPTRTR